MSPQDVNNAEAIERARLVFESFVWRNSSADLQNAAPRSSNFLAASLCPRLISNDAHAV
jgi:hypothetical protein